MDGQVEVAATIARNSEEFTVCVTVCDRRAATQATFAHLAAAEQQELGLQRGGRCRLRPLLRLEQTRR